MRKNFNDKLRMYGRYDGVRQVEFALETSFCCQSLACKPKGKSLELVLAHRQNKIHTLTYSLCSFICLPARIAPK